MITMRLQPTFAILNLYRVWGWGLSAFPPPQALYDTGPKRMGFLLNTK